MPYLEIARNLITKKFYVENEVRMMGYVYVQQLRAKTASSTFEELDYQVLETMVRSYSFLKDSFDQVDVSSSIREEFSITIFEISIILNLFRSILSQHSRYKQQYTSTLTATSGYSVQELISISRTFQSAPKHDAEKLVYYVRKYDREKLIAAIDASWDDDLIGGLKTAIYFKKYEAIIDILNDNIKLINNKELFKDLLAIGNDLFNRNLFMLIAKASKVEPSFKFFDKVSVDGEAFDRICTYLDDSVDISGIKVTGAVATRAIGEKVINHQVEFVDSEIDINDMEWLAEKIKNQNFIFSGRLSGTTTLNFPTECLLGIDFSNIQFEQNTFESLVPRLLEENLSLESFGLENLSLAGESMAQVILTQKLKKVVDVHMDSTCLKALLSKLQRPSRFARPETVGLKIKNLVLDGIDFKEYDRELFKRVPMGTPKFRFFYARSRPALANMFIDGESMRSILSDPRFRENGELAFSKLGARLKGDFRGMDFSQLNLDRGRLFFDSSCKLDEVALRSLLPAIQTGRVSYNKYIGSNNGADLRGADFSSFSEAELKLVKFGDVHLDRTAMISLFSAIQNGWVNLENVNLMGEDLSNIEFPQGMSLKCAAIKDTNFDNSSLVGVNLDWCVLNDKTTMNNTDLQSASIVTNNYRRSKENKAESNANQGNITFTEKAKIFENARNTASINFLENGKMQNAISRLQNQSALNLNYVANISVANDI